MSKVGGAYNISKINIKTLQDVQDKYYKPTYFQGKDCKMEIFTSITFGFLMVNLDTLSLDAFLPYIPSSKGSTIYMVGNIIPITFQWYMELPLTP
jgi:hypothetical protein